MEHHKAIEDMTFKPASDEATDSQKALERFDFMRFSVIDIHGVTRSRTICRSGFIDRFHNGEAFVFPTVGLSLGGELEGAAFKFYSQHPDTSLRVTGNVIGRPIPGTLHPLPACGLGKYRVGEVFCETVYPWNNQNQLECPRYVARKQLSLLETMGFQLYSGIELEILLVDSQSMRPAFKQEGAYLSSLTFSTFESLLLEVCTSLESMGVEISATHVEFFCGQFELVIAPQLGIKAADNAFLAKDCVKEVARKHGLTAIFMTRLDPDVFFNISQFNHSLKSADGKTNIFSDQQGTFRLSSVFRDWMGGLVRHYRAISAICEPIDICRRLEEVFTASLANWGIDHRGAAYRVRNDSPSGTYIENRLPMGSANYYLVLAATVAAGMDGICNRLPCPAPINKGLHDSESDIRKVFNDIEPVMRDESLQAALKGLQEDQVMVEALGKNLVQLFVMLKEEETRAIEEFCSNKKDGPEREAAMYEKARELYLYLL